MKESKNIEKNPKMTGGWVKFYEKNNDPVLKEKDWYKEKIVEMTSQIEDTWILEQIHKFIVNMTKEGN